MKNPLLYWLARPESGREGREVFESHRLLELRASGRRRLALASGFRLLSQPKTSHPEIRDSMSRSRRFHLLQNRSHLVPFSSRPGAAYEIQK